MLMLMLMLNQWEAVDPCPKNMSSVLCYQSTLYIIDIAHPAGRSLLKCNDFVSVTFRGKETKSDQNQSSGPPEPQPNRAPLKSSGFRCLMPKRSKGRLWT